jgi:hypothetical protein
MGTMSRGPGVQAPGRSFGNLVIASSTTIIVSAIVASRSARFSSSGLPDEKNGQHGARCVHVRWQHR